MNLAQYAPDVRAFFAIFGAAYLLYLAAKAAEVLRR